MFCPKSILRTGFSGCQYIHYPLQEGDCGGHVGLCSEVLTSFPPFRSYEVNSYREIMAVVWRWAFYHSPEYSRKTNVLLISGNYQTPGHKVRIWWMSWLLWKHPCLSGSRHAARKPIMGLARSQNGSFPRPQTALSHPPEGRGPSQGPSFLQLFPCRPFAGAESITGTAKTLLFTKRAHFWKGEQSF